MQRICYNQMLKGTHTYTVMWNYRVLTFRGTSDESHDTDHDHPVEDSSKYLATKSLPNVELDSAISSKSIHRVHIIISQSELLSNHYSQALLLWLGLKLIILCSLLKGHKINKSQLELLFPYRKTFIVRS